MSQATLNDDELFGEAASEMRADVESHLQQAYESLPAADDVWDVEAENTLGVLNSLRSALNPGDAEEHLRNAKKWYTMGVRADAFEDADDLEEQIEDLTALIEEIEEAHEKIGGLTSTIPKLRKSLEAMGEEAEDDDEEEDEE